VEGGDAGDVRLELAQLAAVEVTHSRNPVGAGPLGDAVQSPLLLGVERHEHLAALVVDDVAFQAERTEQSDAATAQRRLQGARWVVEPGVDHPAVATGLVGCEPILLLQQGDSRIRPYLEHASGDCCSEDASADDGVARTRHGAPSSCELRRRGTI
jgi:hypothetical protein